MRHVVTVTVQLRALLVCCLALGVLVTFAQTGSAKGTTWVKAGPIWNNMDAERKCPTVCGASKWDGNWKTTEMGRMSVCACYGSSKKRIRQVDAGPIWGNFEAPRKCTAACGKLRWDGNWRTISGGRSTCDCEE